MRASSKLALIVASCLAFSWGVAAISAPPPNPKPDTSASTSRPAKSPPLATPSTVAAKPAAAAHEAQWIWSPAAEEIPKTGSPLGTCYFRRSFEMTQPEAGEVQITADESYELYVNGRKVGDGHNWHVMDIHDITQVSQAGAQHRRRSGREDRQRAGRAGGAGVGQERRRHFVSYLTGSSWKTSQKEFVGWTQPRFNESQWLPAREIGQFGVVKPWLDEMQLAGGGGRPVQDQRRISHRAGCRAARHRLADRDGVQRIRRHSRLARRRSAADRAQREARRAAEQSVGLLRQGEKHSRNSAAQRTGVRRRRRPARARACIAFPKPGTAPITLRIAARLRSQPARGGHTGCRQTARNAPTRRANRQHRAHGAEDSNTDCGSAEAIAFQRNHSSELAPTPIRRAPPACPLLVARRPDSHSSAKSVASAVRSAT